MLSYFMGTTSAYLSPEARRQVLTPGGQHEGMMMMMMMMMMIIIIIIIIICDIYIAPYSAR